MVANGETNIQWWPVVCYGCHCCCGDLLTSLQSLVTSVCVPVVVVFVVGLLTMNLLHVSKKKRGDSLQAYVIPIHDKYNLSLG